MRRKTAVPGKDGLRMGLMKDFFGLWEREILHSGGRMGKFSIVWSNKCTQPDAIHLTMPMPDFLIVEWLTVYADVTQVYTIS